jgi:hypothetical protein
MLIPIIHKMRKKGINLAVRIVIIASSAKPLVTNPDMRMATLGKKR